MMTPSETSKSNASTMEMNDIDIESASPVSQVASVDPFAPRNGKTLAWQHVNMTLAGNKKNEPRKLLDNVWGEVPKQKTTAIMGYVILCLLVHET